MSSFTVWSIIIVIGAITFFFRSSFILLQGHINMPPIIIRALRFVPVSVLCALVSPAFLFPSGTLDISLGNLRLIAGVLAGLVAWRTQNLFFTLAAGMIALWILQGLSGSM